MLLLKPYFAGQNRGREYENQNTKFLIDITKNK